MIKEIFIPKLQYFSSYKTRIWYEPDGVIVYTFNTSMLIVNQIVPNKNIFENKIFNDPQVVRIIFNGFVFKRLP